MSFYYSNPLRMFEFNIPSVALGSSGEFSAGVGYTLEELVKIVWRGSELKLEFNCTAASSTPSTAATVTADGPTVIRRKVQGSLGVPGNPSFPPTPTPDALTEEDIPQAGVPIHWQDYGSDHQRQGNFETGAGDKTYTSQATKMLRVSITAWRHNTDTDLYYPTIDIEVYCLAFSEIYYGDGFGGGNVGELAGAGSSIAGPYWSEGSSNAEVTVLGKVYPVYISTETFQDAGGGVTASCSGGTSFEATMQSYYGWDPGDTAPYPGKDGDGDVYNTVTGDEERDPKNIEMRADGSFYNPNYVAPE